MRYLTIALMATSVFLHVRHGWSALHFDPQSEQGKMLTTLGINQSFVLPMAILQFLIALLIVIPQTFFVGNFLNALCIVLIMALSLNAGDVRTAMIEIPFLALPLILIWLKYPFKF